MAIEAAGGVLAKAQTVLNQNPAPAANPASVQSAAQEATEPAAVTQREAQQGDRVAQRKLAKEQAAAGAQAGNQQAPAKSTPPASSSGDAAAAAQGNGQDVNIKA